MAVVALYRSTIGKKVIMAVTGFIWVGYVVLHMFGNLKYFVGATSINGWAEFLRTFGQDILGYPGFLWVVRLVLVSAVLLHILMAYQLTQLDWASRPVRYSGRNYLSATFSSRTMRWGGIIVALFIVFHLLQFTVKWITPGFTNSDSPYIMVVLSFQQWWMVALYAVLMALICMHVRHGFWSAFATLGLNVSPRGQKWLNYLGIGIAVLLYVGFMIMPVAVMFGGITL